VLLGWLIVNDRLRLDPVLLRQGLRMALASAVMALIVFIIADDLATHWAPDAGLLVRVGSLVLILGAGVLCYGVGCLVLGLATLAQIQSRPKRF
jgi:peptidoglycan biosynthesis protein MviN/MurJ (putative lipid II flippase)